MTFVFLLRILKSTFFFLNQNQSFVCLRETIFLSKNDVFQNLCGGLQHPPSLRSKAFLLVKASKQDGRVAVCKLERSGHIQRRMRLAAHFERARCESRGIKLSDGKSISGRGRLIDCFIHTLQNYYGLAIRRNAGGLEDKRRAAWATYFHMSSMDTKSYTGIFAKDAYTLCKLLGAQLNGEPRVLKEHFWHPFFML